MVAFIFSMKAVQESLKKQALGRLNPLPSCSIPKGRHLDLWAWKQALDLSTLMFFLATAIHKAPAWAICDPFRFLASANIYFVKR